jgi:DNA-binding XRE family transcriptional regulator
VSHKQGELVAEIDLRAIGLRIRGRRSQRALSQSALAGQCHIARRTLINIERGTYAMNIKALVALATTLELDMHYILLGGPMVERQYP